MSTFRAYRIFEEEGKGRGRLVEATLDELSPGEVVVRNRYSSVNYKDALAGTGAGKILRRFPLIGGIDLVGSVLSSTDPAFREGELVLSAGGGLSVTHDGGYAELSRLPAEWVVRLPSGLSPFEAMALGTAGFTAALSIVEMEHNGLSSANGPVIVTGSTGGVGSVAVELLAARGYQVTALTGKDHEQDFLRRLGAAEILSRHTLDLGTSPLLKARWAGAVDAVGGDILAWLTRTVKPGGSIAASGLTAGIELHTTVMPFILRGVKLLGIDSSSVAPARRQEIWDRLGSDLKPRHVQASATEITLDDLPDAFDTLLTGNARGRIVVKLGE